MTAKIERLQSSPLGLKDLGVFLKTTDDEERLMIHFIQLSTSMYRGFVDGKVACVWGLIPPTLMSTQAYLWLFTTPLVDANQFVFVRHSQMAIKLMLEEFDYIIGHAILGNDRGIRWLKWLGAEFGRPDGKKVPFVIRKKNG